MNERRGCSKPWNKVQRTRWALRRVGPLRKLRRSENRDIDHRRSSVESFLRAALICGALCCGWSIRAAVQITETFPGGASVSAAYTYDAKERITRIDVTANGMTASTSYRYDMSGGTLCNGFKSDNLITSLTDPSGGETTFVYDDSQHGWVKTVTRTTSAGTMVTTYEYDAALSGNGSAPVNEMPLERPRAITGRIGDIVVYRELVKWMSPGYFERQYCLAGDAAWNAASNVTVVESHNYNGYLTYRADMVETQWFGCVTNNSGGLKYWRAMGSIPRGAALEWNAYGYPVSVVITQNAQTVYSMQVTGEDAWGRPTAVSYLDGTTKSLQNYNFWGPQKTVERDGSTSETIEYDAIGRLKKYPHGDTGITESYEYDALHNITKLTRTGTSATYGQASEEHTASYDVFSRLKSLTTPLGTTTVDYQGGTMSRTVTYPDGRSATYVHHVDGSLLMQYGTAVNRARYAHKVQNGSLTTTETLLDVGQNAQDLDTTVTFDLLGNISSIDGPSGQSQILRDSAQRVRAVVDASHVTDVRDFGTFGEVRNAGRKKGAGTSIDLQSDKLMRNEFNVDASGWNTAFKVFDQPNSDTPAQVASITRALDGKSWASSIGSLTTTSQRQNPTEGGIVSESLSYSDGTKEGRKYANYLLEKVAYTNASAGQIRTVSYKRDGLGRIREINDSVTGVTTIGLDDQGRVDSVTEPGRNPVTCGYWSGSSRLKWVIDAEGRKHNFDYWPDGSLKHEYGAGNELHYKWDSQGNLLRLSGHGGGGGDTIVEWLYDDAGRPQYRKLNGQTAEIVGYRDNGQLESVTDAGGRKMARTFAPYSGEISAVAYTGGHGCPDLTAMLNRQGLVTNMAGASATVPALQADWRADGLPVFLSQSFESGGVLHSNRVTYAYDANSDRLTGLTLGSDAGTRTLGFALDPQRRTTALSVSGSGLPSVAAGYAYQSDGQTLVTGVTLTNGSQALRRAITWDTTRNRITGMTYSNSAGTLVAKFQYSYENNDADRVTSIVRDGGGSWDYSYEASASGDYQLKSASGVMPGMLAQTGFEYVYDHGGNVSQVLRPNMPAAGAVFEADDNNLLSQRDWKNLLIVEGKAATDAVVSVNGTIAGRGPDGEYRAEVPVDNASAACMTQVVVTAAYYDEANDQNIISVITGTVYMVRASESPSYHTDYAASGVNTDSRWSHFFDGDGRLVRIESTARAPQVVETFGYYPDNRRAWAQMYTVSGGTSNLQTRREFFYDGWLLTEERVGGAAGGWTNFYAWGLDVAAQRTGAYEDRDAAGGVGGLLAITVVSNGTTHTYWPIQDHVGTIHGLVDADTGSNVAQYVYSPYGELVGARGPARSVCPLRFNGKYWDRYTGCLYYGERYYDPHAMKWLCRDPLGEEGGFNLTQFCLNDPVNGFDPFGLWNWPWEWQQKQDVGYKIENGRPLVKLVTMQHSMGLFSDSYTAIDQGDWYDATGSIYQNRFDQAADGRWRLASEADATARFRGAAFAATKPAYNQMVQTFTASAGAGVAAPLLAAGGAGLFSGSFLSSSAYSATYEIAGVPLGETIDPTRYALNTAVGTAGGVILGATVNAAGRIWAEQTSVDMILTGRGTVVPARVYGGNSGTRVAARSTASPQAGVTRPQWATDGLKELAEFRSQLGLIPGGRTANGGVLARLDVGGRTFYGINAHGQKISLRVNSITRDHAEADVFQQAWNAGIRGGSGRLFVDAELCKPCNIFGGVRSLLRAIGLSNIEVVTPRGIVNIQP